MAGETATREGAGGAATGGERSMQSRFGDHMVDLDTGGGEGTPQKKVRRIEPTARNTTREAPAEGGGDDGQLQTGGEGGDELQGGEGLEAGAEGAQIEDERAGLAEGEDLLPEGHPGYEEQQGRIQAARSAGGEGESFTLDELAAGLEMSPEDVLKSLKLTAVIDGVEREVTLADMRKSYQLEGYVNKKSMEVSALRKNYETKFNEFGTFVQNEVQRFTAMAQFAQRMIHQEARAIDWAALKATNPAEWAVKSQEFKDRQAELNQFIAGVQEVRKQAGEKELQAQALKQADERQALITRRPEWANPDKFKKDYDAIVTRLSSIGYSPDEINAVTDHRALLVADAAARYWALQEKAPKTAARVREAPRLLKPGQRKTGTVKPSKFAAAKARLHKTHSKKDALNAFVEFAGERFPEG